VFDRKPIPMPVFDALSQASGDLALAVRRNLANDDRNGHTGPEHAVIVTTLDGAITDWNAGAESLFGYGRQEAVGRSIDIVIPADRAGEHAGLMRRAGLGAQVSRPQTVRLHKAGRPIDVCLSASALRDAAGKPVSVITVAHDLAGVKNLEQKYCLAQKMEAF